MSKYYIFAILLKDCPYSDRALQLLETNNIKKEIQFVTHENKEKFKMENYHTFPQIFLKKEGSIDSLFIGGCNDLEKYINSSEQYKKYFKYNSNKDIKNHIVHAKYLLYKNKYLDLKKINKK